MEKQKQAFDPKAFKRSQNTIALFCLIIGAIGVVSIVCGLFVGKGAFIKSNKIPKGKDPKDYYGVYYGAEEDYFSKFEIAEDGCVVTYRNGLLGQEGNKTYYEEYDYVSAEYAQAYFHNAEYEGCPALLLYEDSDHDTAVVLWVASTDPYTFMLSAYDALLTQEESDVSSFYESPRDYFCTYTRSNGKNYVTFYPDGTAQSNVSGDTETYLVAYVEKGWLNGVAKKAYEKALVLYKEGRNDFYLFEYLSNQELRINDSTTFIGEGSEPPQGPSEPEEPTISVEPTVTPSSEPSITPTVEPTAEPTAEPTIEPTATPTVMPTVEPSVAPTITPTVEPGVTPSQTPGGEEDEEMTATKWDSLFAFDNVEITLFSQMLDGSYSLHWNARQNGNELYLLTVEKTLSGATVYGQTHEFYSNGATVLVNGEMSATTPSALKDYVFVPINYQGLFAYFTRISETEYATTLDGGGVLTVTVENGKITSIVKDFADRRETFLFVNYGSTKIVNGYGNAEKPTVPTDGESPTQSEWLNYFVFENVEAFVSCYNSPLYYGEGEKILFQHVWLDGQKTNVDQFVTNFSNAHAYTWGYSNGQTVYFDGEEADVYTPNTFRKFFYDNWNYSLYASQFKKLSEGVYVAEIDGTFITITIENGKIQTICREIYYEGVLISSDVIVFTAWGEVRINEIQPTPISNSYGTSVPDYTTEAGWRSLFEMDNVTVSYTQETTDSAGAKTYIYGEYRIAGDSAQQKFEGDSSSYPYAYTDGVNVYRYGVKDPNTTPQQLIAEILEHWNYADDFAYFTEISAGVYQLSYADGGGVTVTIEDGKIQQIEKVFISGGKTIKQILSFVNYGATVIE